MKPWLLCLLLLPAVVLAQTDQLVFFTGTTAAPDLTPSLYTAAPFEAVEIHMGILNPSEPCVSGFESDFGFVGMTAAPMWEVFGCGLDPECALPPLQVNYLECEPVGPDALFLLGTFTCFVPSPLDEVRFYVGPVPGSTYFPDSPGYLSDLPLTAVPLTTIQGTYWEQPVFTINAQTVADEPATWSGVKTLYR